MCVSTDSFHDLATVKNAAMNMGVQISPQDNGLVSFAYISVSEIIGSYGSFILNLLMSLHTAFLIYWTPNGAFPDRYFPNPVHEF